MKEVFLPIPGFHGFYSISNRGRIRSLERVDIRGQPRGGKYLSPEINKFGYLRICLRRDRMGFRFFVHRIVAEVFIPKILGKDWVNHKNGIKSDNRHSNLEWVTRSENTLHAYRLRLIDRRGSKNSLAKLTEEKVIVMRKLRSEGFPLYAIALEFGISKSTACTACSGKRWSHVR